MKVLVSCVESGSLREYSFTKDTDTSDPDSPKPEFQTWLAEKRNPIVKFVQTKYGLAVARQKGAISLYSTGDYELIKDLIDYPDLVGLDFANESLYIVNTDGEGIVYNLDTDKKKPFKLAKNLSVVVKHPTQDVFLCTGADLRPEIHTLSGEVLFEAKNPKAKLDIPEKNLVVNACFIPNPDFDNKKQQYKFATITSHGKLRIYDTVHSKKPVTQDEISKFSLKAIASHETNVIVGDTQSKVGLYQTINPTKPKLLGNFRGIVGGTNSTTVRKDLVCILGLDRYIRVFSAATREPHGKVYVGEELVYGEITQDDEEKRALEEDEFWEDVNNATKKKKVDNKPKKVEEPAAEESLSEEEELVSEESLSEESDFEASDDESE